MVSLHAQRWGLSLLRETQDADLGIPQLALNNASIAVVLKSLGYTRARSNRFSKPVLCGSTDADGGSDDIQSVIDILVPALTSRARKNVEVSDVTTIEVPGLAEALNRPPIVVVLELTRRSGDVLKASIQIPDERSALTLKAMAWEARREGKDAIDVWRCLEVARAASLKPQDLASNDGLQAMTILEAAFGSEESEGTRALARAQGLNKSATTSRATRIRALIQSLNA